MASLKRTIDHSVTSSHDGISLECRIHHPPGFDLTQVKTFSGAVVAHPYAPLGGCLDDPVVKTISSVFLSHGAVVGTFNFRGAGKSQGRTSWSAEPETLDYLTFLTFFGLYMQSLRHLAMSLQKRDPDESTPPIHITCAGYSYGSLIVSRLMSIFDMPNRNAGTLTSTDRGHLGSISRPAARADDLGAPSAGLETPTGLFRRASKLVEKSLDLRGTTEDDLRFIVDKWKENENGVAESHSKFHVLLVSPLLPPITWFLSPFSGRNLRSNHDEYRQLMRHQTLAVFGDQDVFTSGQKLQRWGQALSSDPSSKFEFNSVPKVGHSWQEPGATQSLTESIGHWLESREYPEDDD